MHYEVIEAYRWRNVLTGATASLYGAVPWRSADERVAWMRELAGWTLKNPHTGQIGIGRKPCETFAEACELALRLGPAPRSAYGD